MQMIEQTGNESLHIKVVHVVQLITYFAILNSEWVVCILLCISNDTAARVGIAAGESSSCT